MNSDYVTSLEFNGFRDEVYGRFDTVMEGLAAFANATEEKFDKIDEKFDKIDEKFERIDEKFDKIDEKFDKIDRQFDRIDEKFDIVTERFEKIEDQLTTISDTLISFTGEISDSRVERLAVDRNLALLNDWAGKVASKVDVPISF